MSLVDTLRKHIRWRSRAWTAQTQAELVDCGWL